MARAVACALAAACCVFCFSSPAAAQDRTEQRYQFILRELAAGEGAEVEIHAFRRDELQVRRVRLAPAPLDTCELWLLEDAPGGRLLRLAPPG